MCLLSLPRSIRAILRLLFLTLLPKYSQKLRTDPTSLCRGILGFTLCLAPQIFLLCTPVSLGQDTPIVPHMIRDDVYGNADGVDLALSQTFSVTPIQQLTLGPIENMLFLVGSQISEPDFPTATGGTPPYTYSLTPSVPNGLTFDASTLTLAGTPTTKQAATTYTLQVEDATGATASKNFYIIVHELVLFDKFYSEQFDFVLNEPLSSSIWFVGATQGTRPYTYSIVGDPYMNSPRTAPSGLPGGLTFDSDPDKLILSGTPTGVPSGWTHGLCTKMFYKYEVVDAVGTSDYNLPIFTLRNPLALGAVSDQTYTRGQAIKDLQLSGATGGCGSYTYSLSPALPTGLSFDASTRTISGTPTVTSAQTEYTYKVVADGLGQDELSQKFKITVLGAALTLGSIANQTYTRGQKITDLTLPAATGGTTPVTYSLSPTPPAGLSFNASTRTLSGTPTTAQVATTYTYTAQDANSATASQTFTITINAPLTLGSIANQTYTQGQKITDLTLPAATGGATPVTYSLSPTPPAGLSFNASTRTLSGTPTTTQVATTYTYTAQDASITTASQTFTITINASLSLGSIANQTYTRGQKITDLTLPQATGGSAPLTYSLSPTPPAGLSFNATTRTLSGTPTTAQPATTYTYTAQDANGATASQTFSITVLDPLTLGSIANQIYTQGQKITDLTLPAATGGTAPLTYSLSPAPPAGLSFNASTRTLSGTPTTTQVATTYTYTARDANSTTVSQTFSITVNASLSLSTIANQTYTQGQTIPNLTLPAAAGGTVPLTYSLSPTPPQGLSFNASTRTLSGAPATTQPATSYTYTARDANGSTASQTFSITVRAALSLNAIGDQIYTQGQKITDLTLPQATGGTAPVTYSLSPAPPAGLSFNASTRTLSGTPSTSQVATTYTYTARDTNGATASESFSVTVNAALSLGSIANQTYTRGQAIANLTLPQAAGGAAPLSYSLSPAPPAGLSFTASTRTLSGAPTTAQPATTYTYTVQDANGATASQTFTITVSAALSLNAIAGQTYTQGQAIANLTLPAASGGTAPVTYNLSPTPPQGLSFTASTRTLSGTPVAVQAATPYTYTARDANGATASETFTITVQSSLALALNLAPQIYMKDRPIPPLSLPAATGGTVPRTYSIIPALPSGLSFNALSRTLSGIPIQAQAPTNYT